MEMSEKVFLDIWEKHGSPEKIDRNKKSYCFLKDLFNITQGLFIVDHFSLINYDSLVDIKYREPFIFMYWKNSDKEVVDREVFDGDYIYSLCNINKLYFFKNERHLYVLVHPIISTEKQVKNFLGLNEHEYEVDENVNEFFTEYRFRQNDKDHVCIVHHLPFYSFLLQPKQHNTYSYLSKKILMLATIDEVNARIKIIRKRLKKIDRYDYDEMSGCGNTLRKILERLLKYYSYYKLYNLPSNYAHSMLGDLKKHLKKDKIGELLNQSLINFANELSHDTGKIIEYDEVIDFINKVEFICNEVANNFESNDMKF